MQKYFDKKIDPVIGREDETNDLKQILARRNKNNVLIVGDPGVGKTAVVEGLARRIAKTRTIYPNT
jgi:ATP-dependent Clp protease ATP-binding subunit ClpA